MTSPPSGTKVRLIDDDDLFKWEVFMDGPEQSVYAVSFFRRLYFCNVLQLCSGRSLQTPTRAPLRLPLQAAVAVLPNQNLSSQRLQRRQRLHVPGHAPH